MARCTAPINGHRTASGRANCPACGGGYRPYSYYSPYPSYSSSYHSSTRSVNNSSSYGGQTRKKASWSAAGSTILYTPAEIRTLTPVRENVVKRLEIPDLRDVFFVTLGMIVRGLQKNYMTYLKPKAYLFGLVKRMFL